MVPRSRLPHAAVTSYGCKLQCLRIQVRKIARERDKARLDLEKVEGRCLQLGRELEKQCVVLKHTQSKLKDAQAEIEAKELLLQQVVNHQIKVEADTQFLWRKEASLQGRLNDRMKENTQLQNKVTEMSEKLSASEKLVFELQKELDRVVKDKLAQMEPHSPELPNQSECFAEIVLEYEQQCQINYYKEEIKLMRKNFERERKDNEESFKAEMRKMEDQKRDLEGTVAKCWAVIDSLKEQKCVWSLEVEERFEKEQGSVGQQRTEDVYHPGQLLEQEGKDLKMQWSDRDSLRGELHQLLEENSSLKSQLGRLQQELRLAKEKGSKHKKHMSELSREKVEELAETAELILSEKSKGEVSHLNVKMDCELTEHKAGHGAGPRTVQLQNQKLAEVEWLQGAEAAARLECHQQHAACWMEMELLKHQLKALQEKLLEAKASLSLARTQHALQLQQAKAQMNNMVPKKQYEQLQTSLREEQRKAKQLQENLHWQAEQACRHLVRTQEEHQCLLQTAVEQAEGLEHNLRSAEAVLADKAVHLEDAQAQLSRNKQLIKALHEENRVFALALQAAELRQKSTEEKNQMLKEQASALKQLIGKITPASLSG
ncbi:ninein-like protein isoform X4 [Cuculus canorus]|uniref:ninein-like protein isoform X4 n=1 Tax=Cuculus canorus TaxID=55661 RepID=UPI0023AB2338|nr:ninein-like protein isoform X4 [Cuculus canorus]